MRILVVDDEPSIRHLIDRLLTRQGHHVVVAPNAGEASAFVLDSSQPFDAAVLDISMPGLDGLSFGQQLRSQFPCIRLVFVSGWPEWAESPTRPPGSAVLGKPFQLSALLAELKIDMADSSSGPRSVETTTARSVSPTAASQ
jgi:DNA-binding response OmpR family regulator